MLAPQRIGWAKFEPDKSPYTPTVTDASKNAHPTADGVKPLAAWSGIGTALAAACKGAITVRLASGSTSIYALTTTKAYKQDGSDITWDEVTRGIGTSVDNYASDDHWSVVQFGDDLIATNGVDENQFIDVDSGTEFADLSNAPLARYCTVMGDHLLLGQLSTDANAIAWSGVADPTYWTYGYRYSDTKSFVDGGTVQGVLGLNRNGMVFQQDKIRLVEFVGGNVGYAIRTLHENLGCFAPRSIVAVRGIPFWYAQDGFFMGLEARPIGSERVNEYVTQIANASNRSDIAGWYDPSENIVGWTITQVNGTRIQLGYDYVLDEWFQFDTDVGCVFAAISPGYTIDSLGTLGYTMDTIPYPFDSQFWQGSGVQSLAAFGTQDGTANKFGYFQGDYQAAVLETNDIELNPGGHAFIQSARVIGDAAYSVNSVQVGSRAFHGEALTFSSAVTPSATTGVAWLRRRGKLQRIRLTIDSNDWTVANGVMVYGRAAGSR